MQNRIPSIYESFNARTLTNRELSESFIVSEHFHELGASNHTIMVGPRGSGKTTLMRMLQVEALNVWNTEESSQIKENINFTGVFIPTDRLWKSQFDRIKTSLPVNTSIEPLVSSIFVYHIIEKLVQTVSYRCNLTPEAFRYTSLSKKDEYELAQELSSLWKVTPKIFSLRSLGVSIAHKKKAISDYLSNPSNVEIPKVITGEIATTLDSCITIINTYLQEAGEKWCFLFDELELAPEEIIQPLVDCMRGGPADIILKLSLSPYHRNLEITSSSDSSMKDQDLSFINLTGSSDQSGFEFSKRLCGNIFKRNGLTKPIEDYFSKPKDIDEKKLFSSLAAKDKSFLKYLKNNRIVIDQLDKYTENDKRPTIRKVKFVAHLRNYYIKGKNTKAGRKRAPDTYAGFESICKAMEYNPRMLIGIMNKLIKTTEKGRKVPVSYQLKSLSETHASFKSLLCTIGIDSEESGLDTINDLIEKVARKFQEEITGEEFIPEPKGSITLKSQDSQKYIDAIGYALNAGALIIDKDINNALFNNKKVGNARCRLSYLFSHHFGLLTSKGRPEELFEILNTKPKSNVKVIDPIKRSHPPIEKIQMQLL